MNYLKKRLKDAWDFVLLFCIIFWIGYAAAWGAIRACHDAGITIAIGHHSSKQ